MRNVTLSLLLAMSIGAATTASSQSPQSAAPTPDPAWKVPEVIAFIGVKKGAPPYGEARRLHQDQKNVSITSVTRYDGSSTST